MKLKGALATPLEAHDAEPNGEPPYVSPIPESAIDASGRLLPRTPEELARRAERVRLALKKLDEIGDEQDHRETMEVLRRALGEDRTDFRSEAVLMGQIVVLDAGPLGGLSNPKQSEEMRRCWQWLEGLVARKVRVVVPEIVDFEVRRELIRARRKKGILRLDILIDELEYLPITTAHMRKAAELWADLRNRGMPTADDKALDADVILAAQALLAADVEDDLTVATTNPAHLARLLDARPWDEIA